MHVSLDTPTDPIGVIRLAFELGLYALAAGFGARMGWTAWRWMTGTK